MKLELGRGEGLNALLLDYDMQNDIAVFQADLPEESENTPHGIDFSDLQTFDRRTPYLGLRYIPSYPLWTVGYSAPDSSLERSTVWSNLKQDKDTATQKDIEKFVKDFPGNFQHANLFDYHLWKHEEVLRQRAEADETCASRYQKAQNSDQPRFEKMFMADHRALAVGSFEKMLDNERTEPRTSKMYHNMSGFLGNSGGMVCHFEGGDILRPKVIGLCEEPFLALFLNTANGLLSLWSQSCRPVQRLSHFQPGRYSVDCSNHQRCVHY